MAQPGSSSSAFGPGICIAPTPTSAVRKTAKDRTGAVKKTLDVHHTARIKQLAHATEDAAAKRAQIDKINADLLTLKAEHAETRSDTVMDQILALQDKKYALEAQLRALESEHNELSYILNTGDILFKYYDIVENGNVALTPQQHKPSHALSKLNNTPSKKTSILAWFSGTAPEQQQKDHATAATATTVGPTATESAPPAESKAALIQRYMAVTGQNCPSQRTSSARGVAQPDDNNTLTCRHCGSGSLTVVASEGYMYCNDCHSVEYVVMDHDKPSYKDPPKEISYWAYKRINHFNEWLNQTQARQSTEIPEELYDRILLEIKKQRITNMAELTPARVKDILKKLKGDARKYYEHIPFIIHRLNGRAMPHFPPELEEQLRSMFRAIQVPFSRAVLKVCPDRKNFLSYAFVLHKLMQLLGLDEYVNIFQLLRSREKLHQQDQIWKLICEELNWEFVPSL